ncbi:type 2 periplasmic-binding domain-containing protein [Myroides odoratimimus]|uniref:hypothetical protein n=1 Tax=Myroides odoratimimus TaxID=76832 RepID=UPI00046A4D21|nr:hypothetical protein [Myroides odoratimimus]
MKLRPELEPQIEVAERLFSQILKLIAQYDDDTSKIEEIILKINTITDKNIKESELLEYWGRESAEELAFKIALPNPLKVDNITQEELVEIINRIQFTSDEIVVENFKGYDISLNYLLAYEYYLPLIERNFSYPEPSDLFNAKDTKRGFIELNTTEIAEAILTYKPILL